MALFGGVDDGVWRWLNLQGRESCGFLSDYLPGLTGDPDFEAETVGSSGVEALAQGFRIYKLFKREYERHAGRLTSESRVLDFGCGWGRVTRFFLKDVAPQNLVGIDTHEGRLAACRRTNRWARFQRCHEFPPSQFEAESFDFVFAFSVFSHLSEEAHRRWLEEFDRLLRPRGVLALTTFKREFIERPSDRSGKARESLDEYYAAYDRGEFCFRPLPTVPLQHFGDAFIPERYVHRHWTKRFDLERYFAAPRLGQNVIVCRRRSRPSQLETVPTSMPGMARSPL